jgi:anti-sigma factor RsiW
MNHIDERTLALFVSGDLDAQTAADAEAHLNDCSSCKALLASFSASGQWLRSLSTAPDACELAALRAGTLSRIAAARPRRRLWLAASGIAAALAVAAVLFASRYLTQVAQPPVVAEIPPPPAEQAPGAVPEIAKEQPGVKSIRAKARARSDRPQLESVSLISQKDGPPILKMKTNDPNVVILWVMSGNSPQSEAGDE